MKIKKIIEVCFTHKRLENKLLKDKFKFEKKVMLLTPLLEEQREFWSKVAKKINGM